jgi:hypothetical protein
MADNSGITALRGCYRRSRTTSYARALSASRRAFTAPVRIGHPLILPITFAALDGLGCAPAFQRAAAICVDGKL